MKKLLFALFLIPSISWGSLLSVNGSTVVFVAPANNTTKIPVDGSGVTQPVSGTFFQATQPVSVATPYTVTLTSTGVNGSTVTAVISGTPNVSVTNTPAVSQSGTWNIGTVTAVTAISNALPTGTNNLGTVHFSSITISAPNNNTTAIPISAASLPTHAVTQSGSWTTGLTGNNVIVISSFAATSTSQINLAQISSTTVKTSGTAGEMLVSVEIAGSSNTVIVSSVGVIGIDGTVRPLGYGAQFSSMPVAAGGMAASGQAATGNPLFNGILASSNTSVTLTDKTNVGVVSPIRGTLAGNVISTMDCPFEQIGFSTITLSATTTETVFVSSGATGVFNDIINLVLINSDATNGTIATLKAAGVRSDNNINLEFYVPSKDSRGFAPSHVWAQPVAVSNWTLKSGTSVSDLRGYIEYCKRK